MSSSKKIAKGIVWTIIQSLVNGVYGFISVPLLLNYFGKSNYGLIGLALSINVYLRLMDLGFNTTTVRYFANWCAKKDFHKVARLFSTNLLFFGMIGIVNALVLLVVACFSDQIFDVTNEQNYILKNLLFILAISAVISWYTSVFNQLLQGNEYIGWLQKILFIPKFAQIIILVLTLTMKLELVVYYALTTFSAFSSLPLIIWKVKKNCSYVSFVPKFDYSIFKEILPYSLQIFSFAIFQFSANYLRPIILGIRGSIESVSDYRIIGGVVGVVSMLGSSFLGTLLPSVSKAVAENNEIAQNRVAYDGTKYLTAFLCFCAFGVISVSKEILFVYVGEKFLYLRIWLILLLFSTLSGHIQCLSSLILAGTKIKAITYSTIVASVLSIFSCWFLVPFFDVGGTVFAQIIFSVVLVTFYYGYYYPRIMKLNNKRIFYKCVLPFVLFGGLIALILNNVSFSYDVVWQILFLKGIVFFFVYSLICFFVLFDENDRMFFYKMIRRVK